jgi:hypothetical protein
MNLKSKKYIIWFLGALVLVCIAGFTINYSLKRKLETKLKSLSETIKIEYKDISLNAFTGHLNVIEPHIRVYGKTTDTVNLSITLKRLNIEGVSYWSYVFNDKIYADKVIFEQPNITYYHNNLVQNNTYHKRFNSSFKHKVAIQYLEIVDGKLDVYQAQNNTLALKSNAINFKIEDVSIAPNTTKAHISYKNYSVNSSNVFFKISAFEDLNLAHININPETIKLTDVKLNTTLSRNALSNHIATERDHYNLNIDSIALKYPDFGLKQDSLFYFNSPHTTIYQANFEIFRDKLLPDDMSYKPLYSKMLRELNFNMALDTLQIKNSAINYTEKVKANTKGGELRFSNLNANITNMGNTYIDKTHIDVNAIFMKHTPLHVQWNFNVNNKNDAFVFKSDIGKFHAHDLNQFMTPNLNVKLEGEVEKLYFTVSGNAITSQIDAKLKYEDFDVVVLKKNGKEKNKLLSTVLNIFISKDSNNDAKTFSYGSKEHIHRDPTKSIFNFIWLNLKQALMGAIVGNGKKKP